MADYVAGKIDWMAANFPVEGDRGPYVGGSLVEVTTCGPDQTVAEVASRAADDHNEPVVVVNRSKCVLGRVTREALDGADGSRPVVEVMEVVPDTIRPSVLLSDLDERAAGMLVTTAEGVLLGAVDPSALA